jgi:hypothetical protein
MHVVNIGHWGTLRSTSTAEGRRWLGQRGLNATMTHCAFTWSSQCAKSIRSLGLTPNSTVKWEASLLRILKVRGSTFGRTPDILTAVSSVHPGKRQDSTPQIRQSFLIHWTLITVFSHTYRASWYYQCFFNPPTDAQLNCLKNNFNIYIKIDIKTAPTCFGVITIIRKRTIWSC